MSFDIPKVAYLARIAMSEEEIAAVKPKLENVMAMIDDLVKIDTTNVAPLASPLEQYQTLREDVVTETDQHVTYQKLAPKVAADLYLVPQVIE
ncbi:MAG: gatC [Gammaproteobacteria bacterium]|jgi:aspartyl-tRNA(Asn)/glutamyl-tRNA(Gln) amidotransferase subunit C|nr:gatC [Gammaproteobacteria bacterium]